MLGHGQRLWGPWGVSRVAYRASRGRWRKGSWGDIARPQLLGFRAAWGWEVRECLIHLPPQGPMGKTRGVDRQEGRAEQRER